MLCDATSSLVKVFAMAKLENEARLGGTELSKDGDREGKGRNPSNQASNKPQLNQDRVRATGGNTTFAISWNRERKGELG